MPSKMSRTDGETAMSRRRQVDIHRCRFIDYQPPKITAFAFSHPSNLNLPSPESLLLAIGRSNGDIDIWSPFDDWVHKITLKGGKARSIEGVAWIPSPVFQQHTPNRLFSIGSSTYLTEWDITTGLPKQHLDSNAGAIWSLAPSPDGTTLAAGCEDGTIILVDVAHGTFAYSRALERQSSRVLSLAWHPNGTTLVGGCADSTIRAWKVDDPHGRIIAQMKVEQLLKRGQNAKRKRKMDTLVWAVKVASDGTVVSGDSTGSLKIWESKFWSLTQSFQVHKGDVLCLAIDSDEKTIFSSGPDRKTMRYQRLANGRWVHADGKTFHKHDVRAMAAYESEQLKLVVSGGIDRTFSVLSQVDDSDNENLRVLPPVPQDRVVKLAADARVLLSWSDREVKVYQIDNINETEVQDVEIGKRFLLQMDFNNEENISTAAISSNGEYLLVATKSQSKLFALAADEATSQTTVETLGVFPHGARLATFTPNADTIILVTPDSEVQIHPFLDEEAPTIQFPYNGDRGSYINKIAVSPDAQTFASSSSSSLITIQSFNPNIPPQTLPQTSSAITSLSFLTPTVISVTLAERNRLLLFAHNGIDWNLHPWCQNVENMPLQIGITRDKCLGTFILNNDVSQVWLWGANWLAWIQPSNQKTERKIDQPDKFTVALQANLDGSSVVKPDECPNWITYRYREVLLVDYLSSTPDKSELVIVERPRHEIMEDITEPRFYRHEYGT